MSEKKGKFNTMSGNYVGGGKEKNKAQLGLQVNTLVLKG